MASARCQLHSRTPYLRNAAAAAAGCLLLLLLLLLLPLLVCVVGRFQIDESQLPLGVALHVSLALSSLASPVSARPCANAAFDEDLDGEPAAMHAQCDMGSQMGEGED